MATVVIVVGIVAAAVTVGWFVTNRQHPEQAAGHDDRSAGTTSDELYGKADRPSGPDAETMDPDQLRLDDEAGRFVSSLFDAGKPVAVICHGPRTLVEAGRVDGRTLTVGRACERMSRTLAVPGWTRRSSCAPRDPITSCRAAIPDLPVFTSHLVATFADGR